METIGFIGPTLNVFDSAGDLQNCSAVDHSQRSYNAATMIHGAAVLANITQAEKWINRTTGLVASAKSTFFSPYENATSVMFERQCEEQQLRHGPVLLQGVPEPVDGQEHADAQRHQGHRAAAAGGQRAGGGDELRGWSDRKDVRDEVYVGGWDWEPGGWTAAERAGDDPELAGRDRAGSGDAARFNGSVGDEATMTRRSSFTCR